jgi:hypothetical protein
VSSDPSNVSHASITIIRVNVKDVFESHESTEEVTSSGVNDSLGFSGTSRSVENEEGVFGANDLRSTVGLNLLALLMPPLVTSGSPVDFTSSPLEDETVLDERALSESSVDDGLGSDGFTSTLSFVGSDDDTGFGVLNSVSKGLCGETSENYRVDSSETSASEEGDGSLWNHRKVDSNSVSLLYSKALENIGSLADFTEEFLVGELDVLSGFIRFPNDGSLVGVLVSPSINTVVRDVQSSFREPLHIAVFERTSHYSGVGTVPVEVLLGHLVPELSGMIDTLLVHSFVLFSVGVRNRVVGV